MTDLSKPCSDLSALDIAFGGAGRMAELLPPIKEVQKDWRQSKGWQAALESWFFDGFQKKDKGKPRFIAKPGINPEHVFKHVQTVLQSFEPSHEYKITGLAMLLENWLTYIAFDTSYYDKDGRHSEPLSEEIMSQSSVKADRDGD